MKHFNNSIETLNSKWKTLLQPFQVESELGQNIFFDLVDAYSSSERFYHNLQHIQQVLETIEQMEAFSLNLPVIQLAAWFHDVIYDPKSKDNEERSADYAKATLKSLNISDETIVQVRELVLATKNHQASATDIDSQILMDADLSILGADEQGYQAYAKAIRQEYAWITDAEYRLKRKQFLQEFLQRKQIYMTDYRLTKLEKKARQNLQLELSALSSKLVGTQEGSR